MPTFNSQPIRLKHFFPVPPVRTTHRKRRWCSRPFWPETTTTLKATVKTLQQDHGWIEENWIELSPKLRAIASGNNWFEPAELVSQVEIFVTLVQNHIALEESTVYPAAKSLGATDTNKQAD